MGRCRRLATLTTLAAVATAAASSSRTVTHWFIAACPVLLLWVLTTLRREQHQRQRTAWSAVAAHLPRQREHPGTAALRTDAPRVEGYDLSGSWT